MRSKSGKTTICSNDDANAQGFFENGRRRISHTQGRATKLGPDRLGSGIAILYENPLRKGILQLGNLIPTDISIYSREPLLSR